MNATSFRILLCAFFVALSASSAGAQDRITITVRDCQRLVTHVPDADVAYQPGTDVHGRKVVPADLAGATPIELPESITFTIEANLRNFQGGPKADAEAAGAAVLAADSAADAISKADVAVSEALAAAAADPGNAELGAAAQDAAAALASAKASVKPSDIASFTSAAAAAATQAAAADPGNAGLAAAAATAATAAAVAVDSSTASQDAFRDAARVGETLGKPILGTITIRGNDVYFNDQLLSSAEQTLLAHECREKMKGGN